jgi:hypothetical protein
MLAGDPRQLGPVVRSASAALGGLSPSLLEALIEYRHRLMALAAARRRGSAAAEARALHMGAEPATAGPPADATNGPAAANRRAAGAAVDESGAGGGSSGLSGGRPPADEWGALHALGDAEVAAAAAQLHLVYGMLTRNYRSHVSLLELPSRLFYKQVRAWLRGGGWGSWRGEGLSSSVL